MKIIECKFKGKGQDVEVIQLNACAAVRYVANMASKDAALLIKEEQRVLRDRRSGDGSSFDHVASIESDADPLFFPPDDVTWRMMSVSLQHQREMIGNAERRGHVQRGSRI